MESSNPFLNNLFNGLSSVYNNDNGMLNSNMYAVLNSYALVLQDIQRIINNTKANTYIATADPEQLQGNFGTLIGFPKPPRLNSLANGDEIYRAILRALYQDFQLAPTNISIQKAVAIILSFLTTDPTTSDYYLEQDKVFLHIPDNTIQLAYSAVPVVSSQFPNADVNDPSTYITFVPEGILTATSFDTDTNTLTFTGNPTEAQEYTVVYYRDDVSLRGTNWINLTDPTATNTLPLDLKTTENTFDNYKFSYWWNVYNRDGVGVEILENLLENQDQGIVWRLPQKTISYVSPYNSSGNTLLETAVGVYNNQGQIYDISIVTPENPDVLLSTIPLDYFSQVGVNVEDYYIRYSANNDLLVPFELFDGSFSGFQKNNYSMSFNSVNYGTLDFFEIGDNFDPNNLFGYGTKHVWLDVPYLRGQYTLNNSNFFDRKVSLHERVLFEDFFEAGNLEKWSTPTDNAMISEAILNPFEQKEDCIKLFSKASGATTVSTAILPSDISVSGNYVAVDFLDVFNSGTNTYVDVIRTSGSNFNQFRFGIVPDINYATALEAGLPEIFVETYFPNSGNISSTVNYNYVSSGTSAPYHLASGNPNTGLSNTSLRSSTDLTTELFANLSGSDVANSDLIEFGFGWSGNAVDLNFQFIENLPVVGSNIFAPYNIRLSFDSSSPTILFSIDKFTSGGVYNPSAGDTGIAISQGYQSIEVIKGQHLKVNGVLYTASQAWNPSQIWENASLGTGALSTGTIDAFNLGDPKSFAVNETASFVTEFEKHSISGINYNTLEQGVLVPVALNKSDVKTILGVFSGSTIASGEFPFSDTPSSGAGWYSNVPTLFFTNGNYPSLSGAATAQLIPPSGVDYYVQYLYGPSGSSYSHFFLGNQGMAEQVASTSGSISLPYYYQISNVEGNIDNVPKTFLSGFPRSREWHRLTYDFGTGVSGNSLFSGTTAGIDQYQFLNMSDIGMPVQMESLSLNHSTIHPDSEFSYFDNAKVSYYDKNDTLPAYKVGQFIAKDWQGSILDQSTALENRVFAKETIPNFHFLVGVLGWTDDLVFIVQDIVEKLKPAYAFGTVLFKQEQSLDTTASGNSVLSNPVTNWDSGNTMNNIIIQASGSFEGLDITESDPGFITVNPSGTVIFQP